MSKSTLGLMIVFVILGGALMGYVALKLPMPLSVVCCAFCAFMAMFTGMLMFAIAARSSTEVAVNEALRELKSNMGAIILQQKKAYLELLKASSRVVARRVAERTVTEMMHGLENDEQRDAAFVQMNSIVDEELDTLHKALELTGKTTDA